MQHLASLERSTPSPSPSEDKTKFGSSCSINLDAGFIDLPTEPKRRRLMADDTPSSLGSQENSQVSSRSHSPSFSESLLDDSLMSTPSASPSGTLKEYFRRKYKKDELWASIETNYKYLMDDGIIEACQQSTEIEGEEVKVNSNVSFGEFLQQYQEITDWLKSVQEATQEKSSSLPLSQKYLKQSYHEEMIQKSSKLTHFNEYAPQLKQCQPLLIDEVDVFLKEVNKQWDMVAQSLTPPHQDPETLLRDLEEDLECLRKWLDGIEDHLHAQTTRNWPFKELEGALKDHKVKQKDIESHSRIVSAVLKHCETLQDNDDVFDHEERRDSLEFFAHNLERHWHEIWLQSLEWQCRLEDAISSGKGIFHNSGLYLDPNRFSRLKEFTDDEYDPHDVTSSGDDSFNGLAYRGDFIQSPPKSDSSTSLSPDSDNRSGKDSAVASETELKTNSDMSENYQDLSVSTGSDSDREFMRRIKMYRHESRDIGYGSESQSDELDTRYQGITFSGIKSNRTRKSSKCGDFYATVTVDTESSQSAGKTDQEGQHCGNQQEQTTTGDESDLNFQLQQVLLQEESEKEDIKYLIDQADILVQKGSNFNIQSNLSPNRNVPGSSSGTDSKDENSGADPKSLSSSASSGPSVEMVDKGVGTFESSGDCDASAEESGDSDEPGEEISMATTDPDTFDSVVGEEYTSDEMRNGSRDYSKLPKLFDTNTLRTRLKGPSRERPWSVIELPNVADLKPLSASESAIDKLTGTHSDSDLPSKSSAWSQNCSPTFQRHRLRRAQCIHRTSNVSNETNNSRSQVGAKRKLNLDKPLKVNVSSNTTDGVTSGNTTLVPSVDIYTTDDENTTMPRGNGLIHTLQSARFKSSGSSYDDSDTQDNVRSEPDDPNNDASSFSENAWDNYQAPLYPTDSDDRPEKPLSWEPMDDMEFDDEFSLPQSTILATLIARRSEEETYSNKQPKLVPSNQGNFDDSDSDIEELHHVLEESRMQLKVADKSLKKKRKDPLGTGLYLNPGKYGELMATIDTNMRCLESISQHLDVADVQPEDIQTIQDLLYQWEKLQALASERRNQSQELKTMYATYLSIEGMILEGVPEVERSKFKSLEDLQQNMRNIQEKQKLLQNQQKVIHQLRLAVHTFGSQNPSVSVDGFLQKIQDVESKMDKMHFRCVSRVSELDHIQCVWQEYKETRRELELLLSQERELLQRIAFSQEMEMEGYKAGVESDLMQLVHSLAIYEEKLIALQRLRSELIEVSDEDTQLDLTAGIADIRNQLYVAQKQCREIIGSGAHERASADEALDEDFVDRMEVEEEITPLKFEQMEHKPMMEDEVIPVKAEHMDQTAYEVKYVEQIQKDPRTPKTRKVLASEMLPRQQPKNIPDWLKWFPIQAVALAVILGLIYLAAPESLHKLLNFTLRLSPELKYVDGAPPV